MAPFEYRLAKRGVTPPDKTKGDDMDKRLAIDVGGSSIKYALMGEGHEILGQGKVAAPREVKEEFVEAVGQLYDRYAHEI